MTTTGSRSQRPWRRRLLAVVATFAFSVGVVSVLIYVESEARLNGTRAPVQVSIPALPQDSPLERGRHLAENVAQCTYCHAEDWGGKKVADDAIVGRLYSSNLTSGMGGVANRYSDEDFARAIRHGVGPTGKNLWFMPSEHFVALSDHDLAQIILYLRSLPPIHRERPDRWSGPAMRVAAVLGLAPELALRLPLAKPGAMRSPSPGDGAAYGEYLVSVGICGTCHRSDLKGGRHPLAPPHEPVPPDLSPSGLLASWSEDDFIQTMRRGITPDGRVLSAQFMPWQRYAAMSDQELAAIYLYLTKKATFAVASAALEGQDLGAVSSPGPEVRLPGSVE